MKLLIVDDSNIIRSKIARTLGRHGLQIAGLASNGHEAIKCFREHKPELVTMDLTMPEMDGIECIRELRSINSDARILVVSALADKATAIHALKEGAQGFLCKPFSEEDLADAVGELIGDSDG